MKTIIDMGYAVIVEASLDEFALLFPKTKLNCCEIMEPMSRLPKIWNICVFFWKN